MEPKKRLSQRLFFTGYQIARTCLSMFLLVVFSCLVAIGLTLLVDHSYNSNFKVIYTGNLNGQFTGRAELHDCDSSTSVFRLNMSGEGDQLTNSYVNIILPTSDLSTGTHPLSGNYTSGSEYGIVGRVFDNPQWCFFQENNFVSGSVTLKTIPDRSSKRVQGTFEAAFRCQDDELALQGEFTLRTKSDFNTDCLN